MPRPFPLTRSVPHRRSGFTLVELVIVILVTAALVGIVAPKVQSQGARARDARRMQDLRTMVEAIEQYRLDKGDYPAHGGLSGGWDISSDGDFIPVLLQEGYVRAPLTDPGNSSARYFVYRRFARGNHGCVGPGNYYVIGIRSFETDAARAEFQSNFACSGRDFSVGLDFVTGGGAAYQ